MNSAKVRRSVERRQPGFPDNATTGESRPAPREPEDRRRLADEDLKAMSREYPTERLQDTLSVAWEESVRTGYPVRVCWRFARLRASNPTSLFGVSTRSIESYVHPCHASKVVKRPQRERGNDWAVQNIKSRETETPSLDMDSIATFIETLSPRDQRMIRELMTFVGRRDIRCMVQTKCSVFQDWLIGIREAYEAFMNR